MKRAGRTLRTVHPRPDRILRILILGGTKFLGRHIVEAVLARGHQPTLFHRGKTNPGLYPGIPRILGNRDGGLGALRDETWDAVVDTSGYFPRIVRASARRLAGIVDHYTFISSASVYAAFPPEGVDENAPTGTLENPTVEKITAETYGPLKALCEGVIEEAFPQRSLIVRAGLIVGPHDPSDRFTYWPARVMRGGRIAAPGAPERPVQFIHARDLANWIVRSVEERRSGVFNATGPAGPLSFAEFLDVCASEIRDVLTDTRRLRGVDWMGGSARTPTSGPAEFREARFIWIPDEFLREQDVPVFTGLPLWIPDEGEDRGFLRLDCRKARGAGLAIRPVADTVRETLAWHLTRSRRRPLAAGLTAEQEADLLAAWEQRILPA
jgi:2'-hydroxyisoflavone reductase